MIGNSILIFIFMVIIISLFWFTFVTFKENFVNNEDTYRGIDYTVPNADENQSSKYGLERCKVLDLKPGDMTAKDFVMVQEFIQGNRIKEWKPKLDYPSSNSFCYFYDDVENGMQDNMMTNCNCDISKPIFRDNPMIKNVFHDVAPDRTHLHPIKKCVVEFDNGNVTSDNISKFMGALNDEYCTSLAMNMSLDLSDVQKQYSELLKLNSSIEYNYAFLKSKYDEEYNSLLACASNNVRALDMIDKFTKSNAIYIKNSEIKKKNYEMCQEELSELWATTSNNIIDLRKDTEKYNKLEQVEIEKLEECKKTSTDIQNDMQRYINNTGILFNMNENMYFQNSNLYIANEKCKKDIKITNDSIDDYTRRYNICFPNIEEYNICNPLLKVCTESLAECDKEKRMYNEKYKENSLNYEICQSNLREVNDNINKCGLEYDIVYATNKERGATINKQNITITDLIRKNKECSAYLKSRIALKNELERRNVELRKQKELLIIECSTVQNNDEKSSIELAKKQMASKANEIIKNTPNTCGYSTPSIEKDSVQKMQVNMTVNKENVI